MQHGRNCKAITGFLLFVLSALKVNKKVSNVCVSNVCASKASNVCVGRMDVWVWDISMFVISSNILNRKKEKKQINIMLVWVLLPPSGCPSFRAQGRKHLSSLHLSIFI